MARHRREPAPGRHRLLVPAALAVALATGGLIVTEVLESRADRSVASPPDTVASSAPSDAPDSSASPVAGAGVRPRTDRTDEPEPPGPPPTGEAPGFLGTIDLPEVPGIRGDWVGTRPVDARPDIAASLCVDAPFSIPGVTQEQTRTYVVPDASLPPTFGLSETLGRFASPPAADRFLERIREQVASCEQRVSSASVDTSERVRSPELSAGTRWGLTFDVGARALRYRVGVVRVGDRVAQLSFSPSDRFDIPAGEFDRLLVRAGQRLRELGRD